MDKNNKKKNKTETETETETETFSDFDIVFSRFSMIFDCLFCIFLIQCSMERLYW